MTPNNRAGKDRSRIWTTLDLFHRGRKRAVTQADLAQYLGMQGRILRKHISVLREREGKPIGSTCDNENPGYFVMVDAEDLRVGFLSRWRAATSHIAGLRRQAALVPGFVTLDLDIQEKVKK